MKVYLEPLIWWIALSIGVIIGLVALFNFFQPHPPTVDNRPPKIIKNHQPTPTKLDRDIKVPKVSK